jgi:hypothetical protein
VFQVAQLGVEASQLPIGRKINKQLKMMTILTECQHTMLAQCMLVLGEDFERTTPIDSRNALTLMEIGFSGPTPNSTYGMITTILKSA